MIQNHETIPALEKRYRANLINSLGGFKSLVLIGTRHDEGTENLATFSSLFHLGADPALCGIIIRPGEPDRNTLDNILRQKHYTINHVQPSFFKQAHQCSARYAPGESEFAATGLTPLYEAGISAPFVKESVIRFACKLEQVVPIELNGTTLVIGKIIYVNLPDECVGADGFIDIEKAQTVTCSGLDSYHISKRLARLSYAKTDRPVTEVG